MVTSEQTAAPSPGRARMAVGRRAAEHLAMVPLRIKGTSRSLGPGKALVVLSGQGEWPFGMAGRGSGEFLPPVGALRSPMPFLPGSSLSSSQPQWPLGGLSGAGAAGGGFQRGRQLQHGTRNFRSPPLSCWQVHLFPEGWAWGQCGLTKGHSTLMPIVRAFWCTLPGQCSPAGEATCPDVKEEQDPRLQRVLPLVS